MRTTAFAGVTQPCEGEQIQTLGIAHALSAANATFFLSDIGISDHRTISRKVWRVPWELRRRANLTPATAFPSNIKFLRKSILKREKN